MMVNGKKIMMIDTYGYGDIIDRRIILEGETLVRAGYEVILAKVSLEPHSPYMERGIKIHGFPQEKEVHTSQIIEFSHSTFNPDIIHAHDLPSLVIANEIAKHNQVVLIYDAHELIACEYDTNMARRNEYAKIEKNIIGNIDALMTVSEQCKHSLIKTYPNISKKIPIVILENATIAPKDFNPYLKGDLWHRKFGLSKNKKIIVFQGGLRRSRNIDCLLKALKYITDDIHLGLITLKRDVKLFQELACDLGISHRVHFLLEVHWTQINAWLASSDAGFIPYQVNCYNTKIALPNKLFEFIVAGLPFIGNQDMVNVKEVIDTYQVGVYKSFHTIQDYVDAILEMFDPHQGGCNRFREHVIAARPHFLWEHQAPKLLSLYQNLMNPSQNHTAYTAIATKS